MQTDFKIEQLIQENALIIADKWHYDGIYSFYDMTADLEDYEEIVTPQLRKNNYYQVLSLDNKLIGFFMLESIATAPNVFEIGLGLAPNLTGKGLGEKFLKIIIEYTTKNFPVNKLILDVAEFNIRAQTVYRRCGFGITKRHMQETNNSIYPFVEMTKYFK